MKKRILCAILALTLLLVLPLSGTAKDWGFQGQRSITFRADVSDIDNFINGGRPGFDLTLRRQLPQWAEYAVRSHDRDLHIKVSFLFDSYEDYLEKLSVLLGTRAVVIHDSGKGILLEAFHPVQLLGFLEGSLDISEGRALADLMTAIENSIELDGELYSFSGSIAIRGQGQSPAVLDALYIHTEEDADGLLTRQIILVPHGGDAALSARQRKQMRGLGEYEEVPDPDGTRMTVTLEARSLSRLAEMTMLCLDTVCSISEQQFFREGRTVDVRRSEFIDLAPILTEEAVYVNEWTVHDSSGGSVTWYPQEEDLFYPRCFAFTNITVTQDLSRHFGRKVLTVHGSMGITLAKELHEDVLEELEGKLIRGCALECWDEAGQRHYKITYSSWTQAGLEEAALAILGRKAKWEHSGTWLPWGMLEVKQQSHVTGLLDDMHRPDQLRMRYLLPWGARVLEPSEAEPDFLLCSGDTVRLRWRQPVMENCVLWLLGMGILLWAVFALIRAIKERKARPARKTPSPRYLKLKAPAPTQSAPDPTPVPATAPQREEPLPMARQPVSAPVQSPEPDNRSVQYLASHMKDRVIAPGDQTMKRPLQAPSPAFVQELDRLQMTIGRQPAQTVAAEASAPAAPPVSATASMPPSPVPGLSQSALKAPPIPGQQPPEQPSSPMAPPRRRKRNICPHCGGAVKEGYFFCLHCGSPLDRAH